MSQQELPDPDEWFCTMNLTIDQIRGLHESLSYAYKMWPGSPARPYGEQEFLKHMIERMFAMMMEYNFEYGKIDDK